MLETNAKMQNIKHTFVSVIVFAVIIFFGLIIWLSYYIWLAHEEKKEAIGNKNVPNQNNRK